MNAQHTSKLCRALAFPMFVLINAPYASAGTAPADLSVSAAETPLCVHTQIAVSNGSTPEPRFLHVNEPTYIGEQFQVRIVTNAPVYVYVVARDPKSGPELLFPRAQHRLIPAQQVLRLPESGNTYRLTGPAQTVKLDIYASRAPLSPQACAALGLVCPLFKAELTRGGGSEESATPQQSEPPPPPPPPPPPADSPPTKSAPGGRKNGDRGEKPLAGDFASACSSAASGVLLSVSFPLRSPPAITQ